jgi:PAS domain-containing protein
MATAEVSKAEESHAALRARHDGLLRTGALQRAIFNSANFSSIATDARGVIQIFNVGAERMLGYAAAEAALLEAGALQDAEAGLTLARDELAAIAGQLAPT